MNKYLNNYIFIYIMKNKYNNICSFYKDLMDEQCNINQNTNAIMNIPPNTPPNTPPTEMILNCEMLKNLYDNCLTFKIEKTKTKQKIDIDEILPGYRYRK